jgi:hypothetical protein
MMGAMVECVNERERAHVKLETEVNFINAARK